MEIQQCGICGYLAIVLPLWFHVKSIIADFRMSKTANKTILEALNFDIWKFFTLEMSKISKNLKFRATQMVKIVVFGHSK